MPSSNPPTYAPPDSKSTPTPQTTTPCVGIVVAQPPLLAPVETPAADLLSAANKMHQGVFCCVNCSSWTNILRMHLSVLWCPDHSSWMNRRYTGYILVSRSFTHESRQTERTKVYPAAQTVHRGRKEYAQCFGVQIVHLEQIVPWCSGVETIRP